jgi:uncharacterized alkaline shock family protein YloU
MLLTIYILFVLFITGVTLACAWGFIVIDHPSYWLKLLYGDALVIWIVSAIGVVLAIISIMLMFSGIRRKPKAAKVRMTEGGSISITVNALEDMVMRFIATNEQVKSVRAIVSVRDSKINARARLSVMEGTNIPEVLTSLQTGLKAHIEVLAGIEVNKIMLLVEKTTQIVKARVE